MKSIFTLLIFLVVSFTTFSQSAYTEFTEPNTTIEQAVKHIEAGGKIWYITDNTDAPVEVRTYIFYQRHANVQNIPNVPSGWSAYEVAFDQANDITFDLDNNTVYILTEDKAVYIKIN